MPVINKIKRSHASVTTVVIHFIGSFHENIRKLKTWMFLLNPARFGKVFQILSRVPFNMERIIANNRLAEQTIQSLMHEVCKTFFKVVPKIDK